MRRILFPALPMLVLLLLAAPAAQAAEVKASIVQVGFHISHPSKQYDAILLRGGARAVLRYDPSAIEKTEVEVSIAVDHFNSDNSLRDSHMMETLEGLVFPTIEWKAAGVQGASGPIRAGAYEKLEAEGPLTLHGVTKSMRIPISVKVADNGLVEVDSKFSVSLESFGIERPTLIFVPIADEVPITVHVVFPAGPGILAAAGGASP